MIDNHDLSTLPFEMLIEIINYLPSNFIISNRFLHILNALATNTGFTYDYAFVMIKHRIKQSIIDEGYLSILSAIFGRTFREMGSVVSIGDVLKLFNPGGDEYDERLMRRVFGDLLKIPLNGKGFYSCCELGVMSRKFGEVDWDWNELQLLYKFIERNSYCSFCNINKEGVDESRIRNVLNSVGGSLSFEWYFSNNEEDYRIVSQIPDIASLKHLTYDLPFKVRGNLRLENEKIVFRNLWVKKPELCLENSINTVPGSFARSFVTYLYSNERFFNKSLVIYEIISQSYWLPNSLKPNKTIRVTSNDVLSVWTVLPEIEESSKFSRLCNSSKYLFNSRGSVSNVEIDLNVYKKEKECKLVPKPLLLTIVPFTFFGILSLFLYHYSLLFTFNLSRDFYNRYNLSWYEIISFFIGDLTAGTLIGYLAKAYYCYNQGYLWDSHVTLIEVLGNATLSMKLTYHISQLFNSHYTKKSKRLSMFND